jgi:hypothetical protein
MPAMGWTAACRASQGLAITPAPRLLPDGRWMRANVPSFAPAIASSERSDAQNQLVMRPQASVSMLGRMEGVLTIKAGCAGVPCHANVMPAGQDSIDQTEDRHGRAMIAHTRDQA